MNKELIMLDVGQRVKVLIDMGDPSIETEGIINDIDPCAFPSENTPYRVINFAQTECLGWFGENELQPVVA